MTRNDFNNLVHSIGRKLYQLAYRILRDQEGSEDAVQEVFVKLWRMEARLEEYESVEALASTMIKNHCIDQLRRQKFVGSADKSFFSGYYDSEPSPQEQLERNETFRIMKELIDNLPDNYRETIQLRDIDELSYEEIAELTGQNINTLRVNISRARKMVRDAYKKHYYESGRDKTDS